MTIIPIIRLEPTNLILIGDHKQLKPFTNINNLDNYDNITNESILERKIKNNDKHSILYIQAYLLAFNNF